MTTDYYEILGASRDATEDEIKRAYRQAVRQAHPDAGGTAEQFDAVRKAFECLSDPFRRDLYDRTGSSDPDADIYEDPTPAGGPFGQAEAQYAWEEPPAHDWGWTYSEDPRPPERLTFHQRLLYRWAPCASTYRQRLIAIAIAAAVATSWTILDTFVLCPIERTSMGPFDNLVLHFTGFPWGLLLACMLVAIGLGPAVWSRARTGRSKWHIRFRTAMAVLATALIPLGIPCWGLVVGLAVVVRLALGEWRRTRSPRTGRYQYEPDSLS